MSASLYSSSLPTTTCSLCTRVVRCDEKIDFNYVVASPNFHKDDVFTGNVYLTLAPFKDFFKEGSRFYFWITYLPHSVLICDVTSNGKISRVSEMQKGIHGIQVMIRLQGEENFESAGYVQAYVPKEPCKSCKSPCKPFPELAVMWLTPGENNLGFMYTGAVKFSLPFTELEHAETRSFRNLPMELHILGHENFKPGNTTQEIMLGNVTMHEGGIVKSPDGFNPNETFVENELCLPWEKAMISAEKRWKGFPYKQRNDQIIQQPFVASIFNIVPRSVYYSNVISDNLTVSETWLAAQILFSFFLSGKRDVFDKPLPGPQEWNLYMHFIIRAFTMFVSRYNYIKDALYTLNGDSIPFECYTWLILSGVGSYDCEDGALWLLAIFRRIQEWETSEHTHPLVGKILTFAKNMLKEYVICSALVTVTNPCLFERSEWQIKNEQFGYHQTCLLIPRFQFGLDGPKELNTLYAESTCLIFSDPNDKSYQDTGFVSKLVSELEQRKEILALPIEKNTKFNNPIYRTLLAIYSDFGRYGGQYKGVTEIQLHRSLNEGGAFIEDVNRLKDLKKQMFLFTDDMKEEAKCIRDMECTLPMFFLNMDFELFLKELEKCNPLKGEFTFSPIIGKKEIVSGKESIPYLGWELTNREIVPNEYKIYITG